MGDHDKSKYGGPSNDQIKRWRAKARAEWLNNLRKAHSKRR